MLCRHQRLKKIEEVNESISQLQFSSALRRIHIAIKAGRNDVEIIEIFPVITENGCGVDDSLDKSDKLGNNLIRGRKSLMGANSTLLLLFLRKLKSPLLAATPPCARFDPRSTGN